MTVQAGHEIAVMLDGQRRPLRLTLGALAEIETRLGVDGLRALAPRLARLSAGELQAVLAALLRAGGLETADDVATTLDPRVAARLVADCFTASLR